MSEWFRSVPYMLDAAAYAAKFQQESMAAQIRLLKTRHHQQRLYIDKLKREIAELRRFGGSWSSKASARADVQEQDERIVTT
ncbi:hypothetical protein AAF712_001187 [Marasmius tenuissimus]|uniref:Uncharacterized protein n=1 Tax=Marasmius tenuissimus TaxID=585030 RepID=A0ABR3ABJ2_9AGAR